MEQALVGERILPASGEDAAVNATAGHAIERLGVGALIRSLQENGIGQNGNVYAELGSTWREVMKKPDEAAHVVGKLLKRPRTRRDMLRLLDFTAGLPD